MRTSSLATLLAAGATTATAFTYTIGVGKDEVTGQIGIGFDPSYTVLTPHGDGNELNFEFLGSGSGADSNGASSGVHRVVQTSFDAPCTFAGGFDSGVVTVGAGVLQGSGPSQSFAIDNDTAVYYFADIGEDNTPCYLGAVFCVNTDESSPTACHLAKSAALALGTQYGVSASSAPSSTGSVSSAPASASSAASSAALSASSAISSGASRTSSGAQADASATADAGSGAAGGAKVGGVAGAFLAVAAGVAALM